ncbi:MAG: hypothetical protein HY321_19600 [Armatimonadetes bacterium]|nr:hypothetical protein [Armatimonadota bacterium]
MPETKYEHRTDSIPEKLRLFENAYRAGNHDLALSLAESIRDTLRFERQVQPPRDDPVVAATSVGRVADLPRAWAEWARGWSFCKVITVSETAGLTRSREPVELSVAFLADQVSG